MEQAIMIGLDIAKNVFEVHGRNAAGEVVLRRTVKRGQVEKVFSKLPKAVIGLEACGSAHHWARVLGKLGHEVRLMPPAYVKPYVKRNKSDAIDAAACWEAVGRPDMRFVPVKTVDQQAALSLHRSRDLLVRQRTQTGNALRALLAEFGIVAGKGKAGLAHLIEQLRAGKLELPADAIFSATVLADQHGALQAADAALKQRIQTQASADKTARMLQTAPGVGPLIAHATRACLPDPTRFKSGRDFAASLGLTPSNNGTGGKTWTGHITKKGNQGLRRLLVQGATSWIRQVSKRLEKASPWLRGMLAGKPRKLVAVALAARTARILWAMLTHNQPYRAPAIGRRATPSQGAQQQLMAKSVGISDRGPLRFVIAHQARQDDRRPRPRIPSRPRHMIRRTYRPDT